MNAQMLKLWLGTQKRPMGLPYLQVRVSLAETHEHLGLNKWYFSPMDPPLQPTQSPDWDPFAAFSELRDTRGRVPEPRGTGL